MQLLTTTTPRGTRYYCDGQRVTRATYDDAKQGKRLECFQTIIKGATIRHHVCARAG